MSTSQPRILLTSVCRPLGEAHGDAPSVGYELLHGQVTRAQGLFGPRAVHQSYALDYIAENLDAPATVLHYPSERELVRELKRGYDYVGVSFVLPTFHRLKQLVRLVREHSPASKIVLGGYGTSLPDELLQPWADHICREEGVGFMRRLLGEPPLERPYRHPLLVSRLRLFGREVSRTGLVFAALGCPNGCDFCCTSHYFKRRLVRLLPTGRDIWNVIKRYQELEPGMPLVVLDEDFLLNRRRAMELRERVLESGKPLSLFVFSSVRAISQYTVEEILELGIDGFWIGYEGRRSGYAKQSGRPVDELLAELRSHGITVLASMILGFPYQDEQVIEQELQQLLALEPAFAQFLIYSPILGTPFYQRAVSEGLLDPALLADRERYLRTATGFKAMVSHPTLSPAQLEAAQRRCFRRDYEQLGPSIYRTLDTYLQGWQRLKDSPRPLLRAKADCYARELRKAYPILLPGRLLAPNRAVRARITQLQRRLYASLGRPRPSERLQSLAALGLAVWTGLSLKLGLFQHPRLTRRSYRSGEHALLPRAWRRLSGEDPGGHRVAVELRPGATVWVQLAGRLDLAGAERLAHSLRRALARQRERLVLDVKQLGQLEESAAHRLAELLAEYRSRIRVALDPLQPQPTLSALFAAYL